jgi:hypothetical protein
MKTIKFIFGTVFFNLLLLGSGLAQKEEEPLKLSFSKPDEPGFITIEIFQGNVNIQGYEGKEVILDASPGEQEVNELEIPELPIPDQEAGNEEISKEGLKKIKSSSFDVKVIEEENKIMIRSGLSPNYQNYNIKVPYNCSFKISTVNGNISVNDIKGELEINSVNGQVNLAKITGSVVASTVNGTIKIGFKDISPDAPMAFSTVNSPIDVTLPSNTKATLKMKTDMGDIYTNFDMDIKEEQEKTHKEYSHGSSTGWTKWTTGKINGGGPEFVFKSLHGDIHVRKGE